METKNNWKAWLYLAPIIILLSVFTFYPIINTLVVSFQANYNNINNTSDGFTLNNYIEILSPNGVYFHDVIEVALPNTLLLTIITVPCSIILALLIAICLNSIPAVKKFLQTIFFLPYVTNAIAIGMVFAVIFDTNFGIFNAILGTNGFPWLFRNAVTGQQVNYWSALFAVSFYIVWGSLPYKILIFLGGLQNIDQQYYDAAKIDAASRSKTTLKITIPLLSPQILYVMITSFIGAFKEYDNIIGYWTNGGTFDRTTGPDTMKTVVFFIYERIADNRVQYASAAAVILFIIILIFTGIQFLVSKRRVHY